MIQRSVLPLDQVDLRHAPAIGTKAATLGQLHRAGIPIPSGFVVSTAAYQSFVEQNDLVATIAELEALARRSLYTNQLATRLDRIAVAFERGVVPAPTIDALREAFAEIVEETGAVVVRSSAIGEDGPDASFAGQQLSILNIRRFDDLLRALRRCWASLFGLSALRYRARFARSDQPPAIAVIVQAQIACEAAGTLFTVDPVSGINQVVVEAVWGLGEALAQGEVSPDRYLVDRETLAEAARPRIGDKRCQRVPDLKDGTRIARVPRWRRRRPVLDPVQLGGLALLGLQIERLLGAPQDVEWGMAGGRWYVFQSRVITALSTTGEGASAILERKEWTSGFLDERLSEPVSPLGWSILQSGLENIAFREPLRMLGVDPTELEPITRLWNGRPYVNVAVFEALYKLFPDFLLPEDARRFFPCGDVERRKRARRPRSLLAPEVWIGLIGAVARDPAVISPLSNDRAWEAFEREYVQAMREISFSVDVLERQSPPSLARLLSVIDEVERFNRRLLEIHRWSLTDAEVAYSLLRRVARLFLGSERAAAYCSAVVANLDDYSMDLNRALGTLEALARHPEDESFQRELRDFLAEHGHRSFSLDLIRPSFAADPSQVLALVRREPESENGARARKANERPASSAASPTLRAMALCKGGPDASTRTDPHELSTPRLRAPGRWVLAPLAELTRRYVRLRENQRLTWQRGLALLRRLYLLAGQALVREGLLTQPDDVFFLTADEVRRAALAPTRSLQARAAERARRYAEYCESTSYPRFLRGNRPMDEDDLALAQHSEPGAELHGEPVSPGIGRGKARIILHPDDLDRIETGEVLVTRGADPGWTPVFDRLAALVMETGGQLSHASVVAREYRLPTVVGIASATDLIQPGEDLIVDGSTGIVRRVRPASPAPAPSPDPVRTQGDDGERA